MREHCCGTIVLVPQGGCVFCSQCGSEVTEGQAFCQQCGTRLTAEAVIDTPAGGRSKTSWEDRENTGYVKGLRGTLKETLFTPTRFFRKMPVTGGLTDPLLYALIIGMIGLMFLYAWDILLQDSMRGFMTHEMKAVAGRAMFQGLDSAVPVMMTPFLLIIWLFIISGMLHLFLMTAHGARAGFEATFRVVCYGSSPFMFMILPYCGMPIMLLWVVTLLIIGLKEAHETTGGRSAFAVLFPFIFCCGLIMLMAALFMGAIAASWGTWMHLYK